MDNNTVRLAPWIQTYSMSFWAKPHELNIYETNYIPLAAFGFSSERMWIRLNRLKLNDPTWYASLRGVSGNVIVMIQSNAMFVNDILCCRYPVRGA